MMSCGHAGEREPPRIVPPRRVRQAKGILPLSGATWSEVESFRKVPGAEAWCVPAKPPRPGRARTVVLDRAGSNRWWVGVEVGGVVVGDVPSFRADQMPYGGVKESGVGREGLRYAMQDFTYERVLVLTGVDL